MNGKGYEIIHSLPGRIRLAVKKNLDLNMIRTGLEKLQGVSEVRINPVIRTVLVYYNTGLISQEKVLSSIPEQPALLKHSLWPGASVYRKDLYWSLLAGASLLAVYSLRRNSETMANPARNSYNILEYLAAGITGYAVLSHRDVVKCGNKSLHLDTLAGLFSILSLKGDRALLGIFVTWLLNFIEIVFGWPRYSLNCANDKLT